LAPGQKCHPIFLSVFFERNKHKEIEMNNKVIGFLLLVLAISTVVGMVIVNATYWSVYNYVTIILSVICGVILLKQK